MLALPVDAESVRIALWHEALSRAGPGVLLRDLQRADPDLLALASHVRTADPDILVLTKIDFDARGLAARAFGDLIEEGRFTHIMPLRSNEGVRSGIDLNGDGWSGDPDDAHGYGWFPGQGALAVLSRYPINVHEAQTFNDMLWKDLPGTHILPSDIGHDVQRLSSGGHWVVPVSVGTGQLTLLVGHSGPPVFDGPEDRNGRRNLDELALWSRIIVQEKHQDLVFAANTNLDPRAGDGYRQAMAKFLSSGVFQDPLSNTPTAMWDDPGPMRVSYLLPSANLSVADARLWPLIPDTTHHLITLDIDLPSPGEP